MTRSIDDGDARPSRPKSRWGRAGSLAISRFDGIPVIRGPDVASGVNHHVGQHLDAAALKHVDNIAGFRACGITPRIVRRPLARHYEPRSRDPDIILPSTYKPQGTLMMPLPVKPAASGCVPSGRIVRRRRRRWSSRE